MGEDNMNVFFKAKAKSEFKTPMCRVNPYWNQPYWTLVKLQFQGKAIYQIEEPYWKANFWEMILLHIRGKAPYQHGITRNIYIPINNSKEELNNG